MPCVILTPSIKQSFSNELYLSFCEKTPSPGRHFSFHSKREDKDRCGFTIQITLCTHLEYINIYAEKDLSLCGNKCVCALPESNPLRLTRAERGPTRSWTSSACNSGCSAPSGSLHSDSHSCKQTHSKLLCILFIVPIPLQ